MGKAKPVPEVEVGDTFRGSIIRHGTTSGHREHARLKERPCDPCYRAKEAYDAEYRSRPERVKKDRMLARAQGRALQALKRAHPEEYTELYQKFKQELKEQETP